MPELPEVETIRLSLQPKLIDTTISGGELLLPKMLQNWLPAEFWDLIIGRKIKSLKRRGKYLLFHLSGGLVLGIHLRMTGQLIVEPNSAPLHKATYFRLKLTNDTELRFRDQRKFGRIMLFPADSPPDSILKIGPEPLKPDFTVTVLKRQLSRRKTAIKKVLLDQEVLAGLGNIYTDEALFIAGIHPVRPANSLTDPELIFLHTAIIQVLQEGIEHRGTTKRDYCDGEGKPGSYQEKLRVYGRKGLPCVNCQAPIVKMILGGRGTHFCPLCQE